MINPTFSGRSFYQEGFCCLGSWDFWFQGHGRRILSKANLLFEQTRLLRSGQKNSQFCVIRLFDIQINEEKVKITFDTLDLYLVKVFS